jgi:radical S-adenosyl methionine domain-containing protein 2
MTDTRLPLTANFHFIKSCNYGCGYCYATFADLVGRPVLPEEELFALARLLARTYTKVTLVGGEPTLYPRLPDLLAAVKAEGAMTNIVTNGSRIDAAWLQRHAARLDLLTLSIDSVDPATHRRLGRATRRGEALPVQHYLDLADAARAAGVGIKVNTVVTTVNAAENLAELIRRLRPERWKVLQAAPVAGQNDAAIGALTPPRADFDAYLARHEAALAGSGIRIVAEPVEAIRGSYIMVDPQGRFFDSTAGTHSYSRPIRQVGLRTAFAEVAFDPGKYLARGGDADLCNRPRARTRQTPTAPSLAGLAVGA